jgi:hypothetical protein
MQRVVAAGELAERHIQLNRQQVIQTGWEG